MPSITLTIHHSAGLHARPAALFVKTAQGFPCSIKIRNLSSQKPLANAKSPLSVLTQGVNAGQEILIEAEGEQSDEALAALKQLVDSDFGEGTSH
jgi:phosphocarrier protein HPr